MSSNALAQWVFVIGSASILRSTDSPLGAYQYGKLLPRANDNFLPIMFPWWGNLSSIRNSIATSWWLENVTTWLFTMYRDVCSLIYYGCYRSDGPCFSRSELCLLNLNTIKYLMLLERFAKEKLRREKQRLPTNAVSMIGKHTPTAPVEMTCGNPVMNLWIAMQGSIWGNRRTLSGKAKISKEQRQSESGRGGE